MKKLHSFVCFLTVGAFTLQAAEDKIIAKYGQDLNAIVTYDKNGQFFSETQFLFEQELLKSVIVRTDTELHTYNYTQDKNKYQEEYIVAEQTSTSPISTNQKRKVIEKKPDEITEYNYVWQKDSWVPLSAFISTYTNQLLTRFEEMEFIDDYWSVTNQIDYSYYTTEEGGIFEGKLKEIFSFANRGDISSKTEYFYTRINGSDCLLSEIVYGVSDFRFLQKCMQTDYSYPSNNQDLVISETSFYNPETDALIGKEKHTLSKQSGVLNEHQMQVFNAKDDFVKLIKTDYSYQNNNQSVEEQTVVSDILAGGVKTVQSRYSTTFTNNKPVSVLQETFLEEEWVKKEEFLTTYNSEGNLGEKQVLKYPVPNAAGIPIHKSEWKYEPKKEIDTYTVYVYDDFSASIIKAWSLAVFYGENYPNVNKPIEVKPQGAFSVYPNPASENIFVSGDFDSGTTVQFVIYNLTGKLQKKGFVHSSQEAIPVSELFAGSYLLRLEKDGEYTSCVFIKQ